MKVSQLKQKHASTGFAQVRTSVKLVKESEKKDVLDIHSKKISVYSRTMLRSKQCSTKMFGPVC